MEPNWPSELLLVRHAESEGNVARDRALRAGSETIEIGARDADVALSPQGERQAVALGRWWADHEEPFDAVLSSPYVRAAETARIALEAAGWPIVPLLDERLREKELGLLDRLTRAGIEAAYPQEARLRGELGKFYYRPPGGESWADVVLRLRSFFADVRGAFAGRRIALVGHQVTVLCARYVIEGLSEAQILAVGEEGEITNCAVTRYRRRDATLVLEAFNVPAPLVDAGEPLTPPNLRDAAG